MAYTWSASDLRTCGATCKNGRLCTRYAVWSDPRQLCSSHGGRVAGEHERGKTAYTPCTCIAYPFPHRPASGLCEWPHSPAFRLNMRPGTHSDKRTDMGFFMGRQAPCLKVWRVFRMEDHKRSI
jgi:hypothetical protein